MKYFFFITIFNVVFGYEKDITFTVLPGKTDCFYQKVTPNEVIDIEYQVIDATHGELDVSFQLADPAGRVVVADYKKLENAHRHTAALAGDYRFCFDNTFSTFSSKTVFFDLLIMLESDDNLDKDYDDDKEMVLGDAAETYMLRVRDISSALERMREHVLAARRLQEQRAAADARHRHLAEGTCARVMTWSLWQMTLMLLVGITQVYFLKSLFEEGSSGFTKVFLNL